MAQPRCSHGRSPSPFSLRKEFLERQEASKEKAAVSPSHLRVWQSSTAKKEAGPAAGWEPCSLATTAERTLPTVLRCTKHSRQLLNLSAHVRSQAVTSPALEEQCSAQGHTDVILRTRWAVSQLSRAGVGTSAVALQTEQDKVPSPPTCRTLEREAGDLGRQTVLLNNGIGPIAHQLSPIGC